MKKLLFTLALMFMLVPTAYAGTNADIPGWHTLTDEQKAVIKLDTARAAAAVTQGPVQAKDLQKWVELGKGLGTGFNAFAAELGKTVDDLLDTTVGKIGMFLIVWHYIGETLTGYVFGGIWFLVALPTWMFFMRRWLMQPIWEWHENGKKKSLTYQISRKDVSEYRVTYFTVVLIVILIIGFVIMF